MVRCPTPLLAVLAAACATVSAPPPDLAAAAPTGAPNTLYPGNRAPLAPLPFVRLPVGAVRPLGWLKKQLELQNAGFHGHLGEISRFLKKDGNAWLSPTGDGDHGWEEVPYWLKGYGDTAYLLGDAEHSAEALVWLNGAIASQRPDGSFGPASAKATVSSTSGKLDLWPNMVMLNCLMSHHERTGDPRVLTLMDRYFRWQLTVPEADFLPPYWQQQRGGDNLWAVQWLYARTGEPYLLELADKIHRHTADWTSGVPDWHNVNMSQAFGSPTFHARQSGEEREWTAGERNWRAIREAYGQVPGGMFGGDENCREGFTDPRQAIETCGMVEMMYSCERLLQVTGDAAWADRCEDVAFNSLPAALTADCKALRYLTAPNQPLSDGRSKAPGIENDGAMFLMDPWQHRCCQHNFGHGWPYFVEHQWFGAPDNGLAAALYGPCEVDAKVADGVGVRIVESTQYPFRDRVSFAVTPARAVAFPLLLRVPGWCKAPKVLVEGAEVAAVREGGWLRLSRTWAATTTRLELVLPMTTTVRRWAANHDSATVDRGPLSFSLQIGERAVRAGGDDHWPAWSLEPTTPWNYGLELPADPAALEVIERPWPSNDMPWTQDGAPLALRARGARIDGWTLDATGLVRELQPSPVATGAPREWLSLLPMGACRLRISAFPVLARDGGTPWTLPEAWTWTPRASHCWRGDSLDALRDGKVPATVPARPSFPRFTWWDHRGTAETVEFEFPAAREVHCVKVCWFDDQPQGGCAVPQSWSIVTKQGDAWVPVQALSPYPTAKGGIERVEFEPVTTTVLRLLVQLQPGKSGGLYELAVE